MKFLSLKHIGQYCHVWNIIELFFIKKFCAHIWENNANKWLRKILITYPGESTGLKFIPSQSELFRFIPISVSEPMRIIPKQSDKRFVSRLMKNGQKSIRLNPINSETSIRTNPNTSFQSKSIRLNPSSDWSKPHFQSESILMNPSSDWFGLIWIENLVSDWFGFIRIVALD